MTFRVQPRELRIPDNNPFENDLLDRRESVEVLTSILGSIDGPCVLAVDAAWGTGKTTFLKMWSKYLQGQGFAVVEFNAWETDFSADPFVALSSEVTAGVARHSFELQDQTVEPLKRSSDSLLRAMNGPILRVVASMIPMAGPQLAKELEASIRSIAEDSASRYMAAKEAVEEFKTILTCATEALAESGDGRPLVVIIDELDRCRPSYAVELLEVAKHLFAVNRIVFVLAVDRTQLTHSIRVLYGREFNAEGYLSRFFDIDYRLPDPDRAKFLRAMLTAVGISDYLDDLSGHSYQDVRTAVELLKVFFLDSNFSLREVGQAIHRLGLALASYSDKDYKFARTMAVLLMMRMVNSKLYGSFTKGEMTDEAVVQALFESPSFESLRQPHCRCVVEAVIIASKREAVREAIDAGRHRVLVDGESMDQPLYKRYYDLSSTKPPDDQKQLKRKQHADAVLRIVQEFEGWIPFTDNSGVGFRRSVRRLELLSSDSNSDAS